MIRTLTSLVKADKYALRVAKALSPIAAKEINHMLDQFLKGGKEGIGLGMKSMGPGTDIYYLRSSEARVFLRQIGENSYQIVAYFDKAMGLGAEKKLIEHLVQIQGR